MSGSKARAQSANPRTALNRVPCHRGFAPTGSFAQANAFSAVIVVAWFFSSRLSVTLVSGLVTGAVRVLGPMMFLVFLVSSVASLSLFVMQRLGPVWATRLELQWGDPFVLLRGRQRLVAVGVCAAALLTGAVLAVGSPAGGVAFWSGPVSALVVLLSGMVAYAGECLDAYGWVQLGGAGAGAVAAVVLCATAGLVPLLTLTVAVVAAVLLTPFRGRPAGVTRWARVPARWNLVRSGAFVEALRTSVVMMDAATIQLVRDSELPPTRSRSRGREAVILLVRTITSGRVAAVLPALPLAAGAHAIWGGNAGAAVLVIACFFFAGRSSAALVAYLEQPSLRRAYAPRGRLIPSLLTATTVGLTAAYAALGAALAGLPPGTAMLSLGVALLGVLRRVSGRRLNGRVGALISTPMGPVPLDLGRRVVAGNDALILGAMVAFSGVTGLAASCVVVLLAPAYWIVFTARGR